MPKTKRTEKPVEELTYEEAIAELEDIVASLEEGRAALQDSMNLFERGRALIAHCGSLLETAQLKVRALAGDGLITPFEDESG